MRARFIPIIMILVGFTAIYFFRDTYQKVYWCSIIVRSDLVGYCLEYSLNLKIDLHIHSKYSDGHGSPREILDYAVMKGLDGLAITDHGTLDGYYEALRYDYDILLIPGYEIETEAGHVLVLGLEVLPFNNEYENLLDWVRKQGGISILAHPAIERLNHEVWIRSPPDAVEVLNASYPLRYFVNRGLEISKKVNATPVGGSDAHTVHVIGNAYTVVDVKNPDMFEVLNSIKHGSAWYGGDISPIRDRIQMGVGFVTGSIKNNRYSRYS